MVLFSIGCQFLCWHFENLPAWSYFCADPSCGVMPLWWWLSRTPWRSSCTCSVPQNSGHCCHFHWFGEWGSMCCRLSLHTKWRVHAHKAGICYSTLLVGQRVRLKHLQMHPLSNESQHNRCHRAVKHMLVPYISSTLSLSVKADDLPS